MTEAALKKESVGERLHKARLKKKVTIEQAHKDTKIHPKVLAALEEDRHSEVLSPTYVKAFLRSYCKYLELDASGILEDYDASNKRTAEPTLKIKVKEEPKENILQNIKLDQYLNLAKKWAAPAGAVILGVILGVFLIFLTTKAIKKIRHASVFKGKPNLEASVETSPREGAIIKPLSIPENQALTLIARTKADVWLEVDADGKSVYKGLLKKGSVEAYKADEKFQLLTGKGEFLDLTLNGNPLGSPGDGVIKKIILTRKGLKIDKK